MSVERVPPNSNATDFPPGSSSGPQFDNTPGKDSSSFAAKLIFVLGGALLVLALIAVIIFVVRDDEQAADPPTNTSTATTDTASPASDLLPYPTDIGPEDITFTENDKKRVRDIERMGSAVTALFLANSNKYPKNAAEAAAIQLDEDPFVDPETKKPYAVVDGAPKRGEVQYRLGANCTNKNRKIESNPSDRIWALAMLLDDGSIICKSNIFSD